MMSTDKYCVMFLKRRTEVSSYLQEASLCRSSLNLLHTDGKYWVSHDEEQIQVSSVDQGGWKHGHCKFHLFLFTNAALFFFFNVWIHTTGFFSFTVQRFRRIQVSSDGNDNSPTKVTWKKFKNPVGEVRHHVTYIITLSPSVCLCFTCVPFLLPTDDGGEDS